MMLRIYNIITLVVWTAFLVWLLTFGKSDLIRLLHPRLWWVLYIAIVVLVFFLVSLLLPSRKEENQRPLLFELPGLVILFIPLLYFLLAKEARLDGYSLKNRIIQNDHGSYLNNLPPFDIVDDTKSSGMVFSKVLRNPRKYENRDVEIVCQSFVNEKLPENTAMCYRYLITCCAADALPAFLFLNYTNAAEIENDRWIKISGPLSIIRNNDMEFPSVTVDTIEYVEEPAFPWAI